MQDSILIFSAGVVVGFLLFGWMDEKVERQKAEKKKKIELETESQLKEIDARLKRQEPDYEKALDDFTKFHTTNAEILRRHGIKPLELNSHNPLFPDADGTDLEKR